MYAFGQNGLIIATTNGGFDKSNIKPEPAENPGLTIYPNPISGTTTIYYKLTAIAQVQIGLYDISGKYLTEILDTKQQPGSYALNLITEKQSIKPGLYFLHTNINGANSIQKLIKLE